MFLNFAMDGSSSLALPDLDHVRGQVPIFDFDEQIQINGVNYDTEFAYVDLSDRTVHSVTVVFIILAILFFVLGIVALVIYRFKGGHKRNNQNQGQYNDTERLLAADS